RKIGIAAMIKHTAATLGGLAIPTIGTLAWMFRSGAMADMPALLHQLSLYGKESPFDWFEWTKPAIVTVFAAFPLVVRQWVFRRNETQGTPHAPKPVLTFAIAWYCIELLGIVLQGRMYAYHFMVLAPPAALVYAMMPRPARLLPIVAG